MYIVNDNCIKCGLCTNLAGDFFEISAEARKAHVKKNPESPEEIKIYQEAQNSCPAHAIES